MLMNGPTSSRSAAAMARFTAAGIYLVTSAAHSRGRPTLRIIQAALSGGIRLIQLREKELSGYAFFKLAEQVRAMTREAGALLIINDRLDIALATGADGVHLGQDDVPLRAARRVAPDLIIGASTHSVEEAAAAQIAGASYLNIGPLFPTATKRDAPVYLGFDGLETIARTVRIPFTVMGGIKAEHIPTLVRRGVRTVAVVTAITAADDPAAESTRLLSILQNALAGNRESLGAGD
jgi:thiamine-phosphate pyrophosphorylase